jgi:geranylgeranyl pyrophosphate synthase
MSKSDDFTAAMAPIFAEHYKMRLPFLRRAVASVLPGKSNDEWLCKMIGKPHYDWHHNVVTRAILVPMRSYLSRTGKLFRPYLVSLCLEAYGLDTERYQKVIGLAEIIHSASLMADDIADSSDLRRGSPTAHREFGLPIAGISSFSMFNMSSQVFREKELNLPNDIILRLNRELAWEHFVTGLGTAIDLGWSRANPTDIVLESYFDHILYRSCSYTYRMPIKLGALVAQVPEEDYSILVEFGQLTGLAFQLVDDILNVAPKHSTWGKEVGEDITAGKRSLLVLTTFERANGRDRSRLLEILDSKTKSVSELQEAVQLMKKYDVFEDSLKKAQEFIDILLPKIDLLSIAPQYKSLLRAFSEYVVYRRI